MTYPPQQPAPGPYGPPPGPYGPPGQGPRYDDHPPAPYGYVGPPPPRRRTGPVAFAVIGVLVLIGAGVGAYYLFFRPAGPAGPNTSPQQVVSGFAQSYTSLAHTLSADDLARVNGYLCPGDQQAMQVIYDHQKAQHSTDSSFSMHASDPKVTGARGTFQIVITDRGRSSEPRLGQLVRQDQSWLVCDTVSPPR